MAAELVAAVAALVLSATVLTGGAFDPQPRLLLGSAVALVLAAAIGLRRAPLDRSELLGLAFLAAAGLSGVHASTTWLGAKETLASWVVAWALWTTLRAMPSRSAARALHLLALGTGLVAVTVIIECVARASIRSGGTFENPNVAAATLMAGFLGVAAAPWARPSMKMGLMAVVSTAILLTGSRAGLLALIVAAAVLLPPGRPRVVGVAVVTAAAASLVVARFWQTPDILAWYRVKIWSAVVSVWLTSPWLGVGPGGLGDAAGAFRLLHADHVGHRQFLVTYAESTPLAIVVQTGLVGAAILGTGAWSWFRRQQRGPTGSRAVLTMLVPLVVFTLFHDVGAFEGALWWWWAMVGLVEAIDRPGPLSSPSPEVDPAGRLVRGLVVAGVVLWGIVQPAWARTLWRSGEPGTTLATRAMRAEPWFADPAHAVAVQLLLGEDWGWERAGESLMWIERALRVHRGSSRLWADAGRIRLRSVEELGGTETEISLTAAAFDRACRLDPWVPWTWLERARLERLLGHNDVAVDYVHTALDSEPSTVRAWLLLARLELDRGRIDVARQALQRAVALKGLATLEGLSDYERELLAAPDWQVREIDEALR